MTDNDVKLTDKQIISGLDNLFNHKYVIGESKGEFIRIGDVANLINRQKTEIENLNIELQAMRGAANSYKAELEQKDLEIQILIRKKEALKDEISELTAEVERLKNAYKQCAWERDVFAEETKTARTEAITEFVERIRQEINFPFAVWRVFDNLVKEMVGELK